MMGRKSLLLVLMMIFPGLASNASAALVARWTFNNSPNDQVGALNWTLNGGATYSTERKEGSHSLQCDGVDDYAGLAGSGLMSAVFSTRTVMLWFKPNSTTGTQVLYDEGGYTQGLCIRINDGVLETAVRASSVTSALSAPLSSTGWSHVAVSFDSGPLKLYLNGVEVAAGTASFTSVPSHTNAAGLGARNSQDAFGGSASGDYYGGLIDDVQMYDNALSAAQIADAMAGWPKARQPSPADGAVNVGTPLFQWTAGGGALWHDVYLGTGPDLGPADLVGPHTIVPMYWHIPPLTPGGTYYWRIDETSADGTTVVQGDVWSFTYASLEAWNPLPANGAKYIDPNLTLTWNVGLNGITHDVYFGQDKAAVDEGTAETFRGNVPTLSFPTGALQPGTAYYWRIDEVDAQGQKVKGSVWIFTTVPEIPVTDPSLAARWTLDEGMGTRVVDWSGHGHHGDFVGNMQWVDGYDGAALQFAAVAGEHVEMFGYEGVLGKQDRTCSAWIKTGGLGAILSWGQAVTSQKWIFRVQDSNGNAGALRIEVEGGRIVAWKDLRDNEWHHVAAALQSAGAPTVQDIKLYVDGLPEAISDSLVVDIDTAGGRNVWIGNDHSNRPFPGLIDDVRIYDKALTPDDLAVVMRIDPLRAGEPSPASGALADIRTATPLTWTKGDNAAKHDVYFGIDEAAVTDANTSDTTGVYRGRVSTISFTPAEDLQWGQKYFWRVDENNADGTITPGRVWTFIVAGYLIVDDFESYTDLEGSRIYETWIDGWTNGTGAVVGNLVAPFAERTVVYSGKQSMPLDYNSANPPWYSEAELEFSPVQNWTFGEANTLVVHFRGAPVDFLESGGTITLSAAGTDIWNTTDEFRYAFKRLTGDGSIIARVDSITNTNVWAKGGVMIRETLDPSSRQAMVVVTPGSGVAFQRRLVNNDVSVGTTQAGITAPHWVKLTRTGNVLTAQHSADGVTWVDVAGAAGTTTSDTVVMGGTIYIGVALTSHAANVACTAVFSDIKTTGNVTGSWQQAEVGVDHPGNSAQGLYVGIEDSAGKVAFVTHPDPAAATIGAWTEWAIPLSSLTGVNPAKVKKMYVGVGDRQNPVPDGTGRIYIDDIRVTKGIPQPTP
jgi:hypothetical protein